MRLHKYLIAFAFCSTLPTAHAAITVGRCDARSRSFATITQAIAAARAGETINICPGSYPEQLTITKSLVLRGISIAGQPGATITAPAAGLQPLPAGSSSYPQVYINHAGLVSISNLGVDGTNANIVSHAITFDTTTACQVGFLKDFPGIYVVNTTTQVANVGVSAHFAYSGSPEATQLYPNCGSGIEFSNRGEQAIVTDSVINSYGYTGISSTGPLQALRNVLTGPSGPYQVGIEAPASSSVIANNTVTGAQFNQSTGIQGGWEVNDNVVQGWMTGIIGARLVYHNTLVNNAIGIASPEQALTNLVTAPVRYNDPNCQTQSCAPDQTTKPTIGIEMQCEDASLVLENGFVGLGVGVADVKRSTSAVTSNSYAGAGVLSTGCAVSN